MEVKVSRHFDTGDMTLGHITIDNQFYGWTLEDEYRKDKKAGETRIPEGKYLLTIRKEDTPLTLKHRKAYGDWFKYHIEISGIPNFTGVYVHAGNDDDHTDGCLLLGDVFVNPILQPKNPMTMSVQAVKRFYDKVYPELEKGEKVYIEIIKTY